ncbi:MAG: N-acetylglucosaminyl-diphospho-decaprenol L-rhamnosyltransferase [Syntrophomonadaceae bacterium]|nr:N-acetylglucosaminyl-diphospho-decaprenol L-rhamnosyltransferase [Bacillota bacterium]MBT9148045.1 N-acetylglucosaminyl-diphospho-decaprenol L-rhamnosyltransferase [Bacillota bacterium]
MQKPNIQAIVLNWNNYIDTKECIESLQQSCLKLFGVVVVDNGSQDGSSERLQQDFSECSHIKFIRNESNYGFARGVNVGIRYALDQNAEYIFLLNNDAIVDKNCIGHLFAEVNKDPFVGIAGPRIFYYKDPQRIWQGGGYFSRIKTGVINPEKNKLAVEFSEETKYVTFLTGCAMLIKCEVFEKIKCFDEDYFFYNEDLDFCLRAMRAGFRLFYVPEAKVWHKIENIAKDRTTPFVLYHLAKGNILLLRKNFRTAYFLYGFLVHLLGYTPYRMMQIIRGSRSTAALLAWMKGTWAGLTSHIGVFR